MKPEIEWLEGALAAKDAVPAMVHYRVKNGMITATNGRMLAGYPCDIDGEFLMPGIELGNILKRLPDEPQVTITGDKLTLRSGRFSGTLVTLPNEEWRFPDLEDLTWSRFPVEIIPIMKDLRPFVSEDAVYRWSQGLALSQGWCFATNNIVIAGAALFGIEGIESMLPEWVLDFLLARTEGLTQWSVNPKSMAFRWSNGAWMRSNVIDERFPATAIDMVRDAPAGTQVVTDDYRRAVIRICELTEEPSPVMVYADRVEGRTLRSVVTELLTSEVPAQGCSYWTARQLDPVMRIATSWSPSAWTTGRSSFHGVRVRGYLCARRGL